MHCCFYDVAGHYIFCGITKQRAECLVEKNTGGHSDVHTTLYFSDRGDDYRESF